MQVEEKNLTRNESQEKYILSTRRQSGLGSLVVRGDL
jgi:hypothetical protein